SYVAGKRRARWRDRRVKDGRTSHASRAAASCGRMAPERRSPGPREDPLESLSVMRPARLALVGVGEVLLVEGDDGFLALGGEADLDRRGARPAVGAAGDADAVPGDRHADLACRPVGEVVRLAGFEPERRRVAQPRADAVGAGEAAPNLIGGERDGPAHADLEA